MPDLVQMFQLQFARIGKQVDELAQQFTQFVQQQFQPAQQPAPPAPEPAAPPPVPRLVKTRRQSVLSVDSPSDADRRRTNLEVNRAALDKLYREQYPGGRRSDEPVDRDDVYASLAAASRSAYFRTPVTTADFRTFLHTPGARVHGQDVMTPDELQTFRAAVDKYVADRKEFDLSWQEYLEDLEEYNDAVDEYNAEVDEYEEADAAYRAALAVHEATQPPDEDPPDPPDPPRPPGPPPQAPVPPPRPTQKGFTTRTEAAAAGTYFYVTNRTYDGPPQTSRRIVVNVRTQEAALRVASSLSRILPEGEGRRIEQFKVLLSTSPKPAAGVKNDKLVIYYSPEEGDGDGPDLVGNRITAVIEGAVDADDVDTDFAPFYSRVRPGIAWAEEPDFFVESMKGKSLTETRSDILTEVINSNGVVASEDAFAELVNRAFERARVSAETPHRHLVSG